MFARELHRRYAKDGIVANALHPGIIPTKLARDQNLGGMMLGIFALPFMRSVRRGAATSVYVATRPDYGLRGGLYFSDCREQKPPHKLALDDQVSRAVWKRSCELTGLAS